VGYLLDRHSLNTGNIYFIWNFGCNQKKYSINVGALNWDFTVATKMVNFMRIVHKKFTVKSWQLAVSVVGGMVDKPRNIHGLASCIKESLFIPNKRGTDFSNMLVCKFSNQVLKSILFLTCILSEYLSSLIYFTFTSS
jgi:hypothetical protein